MAMTDLHRSFFTFIVVLATFIAVIPLPRELRDEIYSYLWSEDVLDDVRKGLDPAPDSFPDHHGGHNPTRRPWYLQRKYLDLEATREVVESFYRCYTDFEVSRPRDIDALLDHDLFGVDVRPKEVALKELTVWICFSEEDQSEFIDPEDVIAYLEILDTHRLSLKFTLNLHLWSDYSTRLFGCECPIWTSCPVRKGNLALARNLRDMLKELNSFLEDFVEGGHRRVRLKVELGRNDQTHRLQSNSMIGDGSITHARERARTASYGGYDDGTTGFSFEVPVGYENDDIEEWLVMLKEEWRASVGG